ncbi:hypothetical protein QE152_g8220 [Popillia japonica]|uniref:Uncharacterized protein n=1 Tax=Popillia japonica TaxID=7064 RepID=A0AAW1MCX1_POPJA
MTTSFIKIKKILRAEEVHCGTTAPKISMEDVTLLPDGKDFSDEAILRNNHSKGFSEFKRVEGCFRYPNKQEDFHVLAEKLIHDQYYADYDGKDNDDNLDYQSKAVD